MTTEIKKLHRIFMNFDPKHDSNAEYFDVIDTNFWQNLEKLSNLQFPQNNCEV